MVEYDVENHLYKIDGERVPSVTELLPEQSFYCTPEQLEAARLDGVDNHNKIRMYYDTGQTFEDPFIEQYHNLIEENKNLLGGFQFNEKFLFSVRLKFGGTPDTIYEKAIIDLKRSKGDDKRQALQMAGYNILLRENKIQAKKIWLLIYGVNDKLKIKNIYDSQAENIFLALRKRYDLNQAIENYIK